MCLSAFARRRRSIVLLALVIASACVLLLVDAVASPEPARAFVGYCDTLVPARTDCATSPGQPGDWYDGVFALNSTTYPGNYSILVCEHTYYGFSTVDRVCGNSNENYAIESTSAVCSYYDNGTSLSGHSGNDSAYAHTIDGLVDNTDYYGEC